MNVSPDILLTRRGHGCQAGNEIKRNNCERPHSSLGYKTPREFRDAMGHVVCPMFYTRDKLVQRDYL
jgi:hypothetical protein